MSDRLIIGRVAGLDRAPARQLTTIHGLSKNEKFLNMNRQRVWQSVKQAGRGADIEKRVYSHYLMRHSDGIKWTRQLRHPKALQEHFGWTSPYMVMRYLSTLQEVRFDYTD